MQSAMNWIPAKSRLLATLIATGNELREKLGADILARRILEKFDANRNYVIDSIRNPAEVEAFRKIRTICFVEYRCAG